MTTVLMTSQEFADKLEIQKESARLLLRGLTSIHVAREASTRREAGKRGRGETVYEMGDEIVNVLIELRSAYGLVPSDAEASEVEAEEAAAEVAEGEE